MNRRIEEKKGWSIIGVLLTVFVAMVVLLGFLGKNDNSEYESLAKTDYEDLLLTPNSQASPFEFELAGGGQVKLSDYEGERLFITFFTTWCPACNQEIEILEELKREYKNENFLYVNLTMQEESIEDVNTFINAKNLKVPVALDTMGISYDKYQIFATPTTILINEEGFIEDVFLGNIDKKTYEYIINN